MNVVIIPNNKPIANKIWSVVFLSLYCWPAVSFASVDSTLPQHDLIMLLVRGMLVGLRSDDCGGKSVTVRTPPVNHVATTLTCL